MKVLKSIRWRLQLWYGVILVLILTAFGVTAYQLERARQFRNIDDELRRRSAAVVGTLRPPIFRGRGPRGRALDPLPMEQLPGRPFGGPADDSSAGEREFRLPPSQAGLFEGDDNPFYFIIWRRDGLERARSANAPTNAVFAGNLRFGPPPPPRMRDSHREVIHAMAGEVVLVGCDMTSQIAELQRVRWILTAIGGVVLVLGLAGGWWIAGRAIRPIENISATALKIAAGDLSRRIDVADTESELGRLAAILNSTFTRLDVAFRQQARFTADAAHELRTPVAVVLTQTQTTLKRERDAAEYRETLEACQRAAQRMRRLLESLLQLARLDAGQERLFCGEFNLATMVDECVELVRPLTTERHLTLDTTLVPVQFTADAERLSQVLTNLLTNAIEHNKENGSIHVKLEEKDAVAILTVSDTGNGIPAEDLPHVFERFYRGEAARSGAGVHAGLGLAIAKAIVEAHSGTIEVISALGEGTTFTVRLPSRRPEH